MSNKIKTILLACPHAPSRKYTTVMVYREYKLLKVINSQKIRF